MLVIQIVLGLKPLNRFESNLLQAALMMREAALREWAALGPENTQLLRSYLLQYVMRWDTLDGS